MPGHSVILTSYNRPRLIQEAIRSVLSQTSPDFELLIVDDGSTDETLDSIKAATKNDSRCLLLRMDSSDPGDRSDCVNRLVNSINIGLERARGEIIHYLADDDFYNSHRFQSFDQIFLDPEIIVAYGRLFYVDAAGLPTGESIYFDHIDDPWNKLDHNQLAHRRVALNDVKTWGNGDFGDYAPDGHFFRRLRNLWDFHGIDKPVAYKRLHDLNMQKTKKATGAHRELP